MFETVHALNAPSILFSHLSIGLFFVVLVVVMVELVLFLFSCSNKRLLRFSSSSNVFACSSLGNTILSTASFTPHASSSSNKNRSCTVFCLFLASCSLFLQVLRPPCKNPCYTFRTATKELAAETQRAESTSCPFPPPRPHLECHIASGHPRPPRCVLRSGLHGVW